MEIKIHKIPESDSGILIKSAVFRKISNLIYQKIYPLGLIYFGIQRGAPIRLFYFLSV